MQDIKGCQQVPTRPEQLTRAADSCFAFRCRSDTSHARTLARNDRCCCRPGAPAHPPVALAASGPMHPPAGSIAAMCSRALVTLRRDGPDDEAAAMHRNALTNGALTACEHPSIKCTLLFLTKIERLLRKIACLQDPLAFSNLPRQFVPAKACQANYCSK